MSNGRRVSVAYVSAIAFVGFPIALLGARGFVLFGAELFAFGLILAPVVTFAVLLLLSLPLMPLLVWAAGKDFRAKLASLAFVPVYVIVGSEIVLALYSAMNASAAERLGDQLSHGGTIALTVLLIAISALFYAIEAVLRHEGR